MEQPSDSGLDDDEFDSLLPVTRRERKCSLVSRRIDGLAVVDLAPIPVYGGLPPHRKLLVMVLLLVVKDRASELHFEPYRPEDRNHDSAPLLRMLYKVDGELLELVPPPEEVWHHIRRDLEEIAGLTAPRRQIANRLRRLASRIEGEPPPSRHGRFLLGIGDETLEVELAVWPSYRGER